jgi:RNA polymerase sigma-70 factor (ECF subfamily)
MRMPSRDEARAARPRAWGAVHPADSLKVSAAASHVVSSPPRSSGDDDILRARIQLERQDGSPPLAAQPAVDRGGAGVGNVRYRDARFRELYENWFDHILKWLHAFGAPASETEDLAQEIFLVVRRKLSHFDGENVAGWLYRITQLTVRDHRRRSWFRNLVMRRREIDLTELSHGGESPERRYEQRENRRIFQELMERMSEKRRTTFVLFEVEGYSGQEIAEMQDVPLGTVWTRLHHARRDFRRLVKNRRREEQKKK